MCLWLQFSLCFLLSQAIQISSIYMHVNNIPEFMEKFIIATNPGKGIEWNIGGGYEPLMYARRAAAHETNEKQKAYGYKFDD